MWDLDSHFDTQQSTLLHSPWKNQAAEAIRFTYIIKIWKHHERNQSIQTKTNMQLKTEE